MDTRKKVYGSELRLNYKEKRARKFRFKKVYGLGETPEQAVDNLVKTYGDFLELVKEVNLSQAYVYQAELSCDDRFGDMVYRPLFPESSNCDCQSIDLSIFESIKVGI